MDLLQPTPTGALQKVNGVDAYFVSRTQDGVAKTFAVVFLTDAFGLELVNSKLIADEIAKQLACDVWVPDLFNGQPILKPDGMEAQLLPGHPGPWPLWDKIRLIVRVIRGIRPLYRARPAAVSPHVAEQHNYGKLGSVGYRFGAGVAVGLVPFKVLDSMVLCHPSALSESLIKVPTAWVCAEQDIAFSKDLRSKAEASFAARKDKEAFVPYEFVDYKGTLHWFACRPNLAYEDIKAGFQGSLSQTVEWFRKTLAA